MYKLFDSHAHINLGHYDADRENIIAEMFEKKIEKIVIPGVDLATITSAIELAEKNPNKIYAGVGFHPQDAIKWDDSFYDTLKQLTNKECVVAIGEVGLDYYWDTTPKEIQHRVLKLQIELAKECKLPLIIHTRDSLEDTFQVLKENKANEVGGVFHCFSGDLDFAKKCLELNFYISFAGNITFKNAQNLRDVAKIIPLENILIETDSPYLTPMPNRGKRNSPSYVEFVAKQIAEIKGLTFEEVANVTYNNACKLFQLDNE